MRFALGFLCGAVAAAGGILIAGELAREHRAFERARQAAAEEEAPITVPRVPTGEAARRLQALG